MLAHCSLHCLLLSAQLVNSEMLQTTFQGKKKKKQKYPRSELPLNETSCKTPLSSLYGCHILAGRAQLFI